MEKADPNFVQIYQQLGQYWGNQPGTSGPVYVGAFVCMLFILGLFIVKGPMKWALLAATILSILLAWGRNFMPFTNFFLDYVPMYAKDVYKRQNQIPIYHQSTLSAVSIS